MVWVFLTPMHFPIMDSLAAILKVLLVVGEIFLFHWETLQIFEPHLWLGLQTPLVYQTWESWCMIPDYFVFYTSAARRSFFLSLEMCLLCNALQTAAEQVQWDNPSLLVAHMRSVYPRTSTHLCDQRYWCCDCSSGLWPVSGALWRKMLIAYSLQTVDPLTRKLRPYAYWCFHFE